MLKTLLFSFVIVSFAFTSFGQHVELQVTFEKLLKKSDTSSRVHIDKESGYLEIRNTLEEGTEVGFRIPYKEMNFSYSRKSIGTRKRNSRYVKMTCANSTPCFMTKEGKPTGISGYWQEFKSKADAFKFLELKNELKQQ